MTEPVPISALEHYEYCARQCALILVDGVWADNRHTVKGQRFHRRADEGGSSSLRGTLTLRSVEVWSDNLGVIGRADAVEIRSGEVIPVEYKSGTRHGLTATVQLCVIAMCLEEMLGVGIHRGGIWYGRHRRRDEVFFDPALRDRCRETVQAVHRIRSADRLPVAEDDSRCSECQLSPMCLPERSSALSPSASDYVESEVFAEPEGWNSEGP